MLAALLIKGISPGPEFVSTHPDIFGASSSASWSATCCSHLAHPVIRLWVKLLAVPFDLLFPSVLVLICVGGLHDPYLGPGHLLVLFFGCVGTACGCSLETPRRC